MPISKAVSHFGFHSQHMAKPVKSVKNIEFVVSHPREYSLAPSVSSTKHFSPFVFVLKEAFLKCGFSSMAHNLNSLSLFS